MATVDVVLNMTPTNKKISSVQFSDFWLSNCHAKEILVETASNNNMLFYRLFNRYSYFSAVLTCYNSIKHMFTKMYDKSCLKYGHPMTRARLKIMRIILPFIMLIMVAKAY